MKLASQKSGRDGQLLVVSRDLTRAVNAADIAPTLQSALDNWAQVQAPLQRLYQQLNADRAAGAFALDLSLLAAPLPRGYQYLDGASYVSHIRRNRQARGEALPQDILQTPLMYQGISHGFMAWNETIRLPDDNLGIDFEAEIAVLTDDVPLGVSADEATGHIKLFVLLNDISLRALIPKELKRTFGFLTGKPASSLGPVAVTADELGSLWDGQLVSGTMTCEVRGQPFGRLQTGIDTPFHYGHLIAHAAQTRKLEPGTMVGLGTVSNEDESSGFGCIAEKRAVQTIRTGQAQTPFLKFGDSLKIDHLDHNGQSVFGAIAQRVEPL